MLPERPDLRVVLITIPYSSTGSVLVIGPVSVRRELKDMGRPMRLPPRDALSGPLVLRFSAGLPSVDIDNGFAVGIGGGAIEPRTVWVERWLSDNGPSRESVEDPRLIRPPAGKTGTLVRLRELILLVSVGDLKKSGEPGRDVVGVGIDVRPLVNERLGPILR